ncbi:hypothetical protein RND71_040170 [Anisodus tanguticus]|uniref:Embryo sac development arrest 6 n=1 Tax=Anisodus tanguticus TaxID=243964 RepID=A0AAE1QX44_9SOLA|nr:hypothetical protein RND71_040170 [Anisodus tanguticus]
MNYHSRRISTLDESSRKRKDRDTFYSSPRPLNPLTAVSNASVSRTTSFNKGELTEPKSQMPNPLLAGYMAYEFLTKGTLLGQKFDPAQAKTVSVNALAEPKKRKLSRGSSSDEAEPGRNGKVKAQSQNYVELASLLRSDGTHIPGIVNPTQLAQWIKM